MATYVFTCDQCRGDWEIRAAHETLDTLDLKCPDCEVKLRRKFVWPMAQVWAGKFHDRWAQVQDMDGLGPTW